ncbi:aminotransferase class I/II-fold pyridoxal phosphate-dependent enzyme [Candidatus Micrarchaeota archaeon]|nr:aminotransferase class I/II-fold pyridoxal phosphate-dependent enzyme [Candidatus Micrarchaeota archaeon]
MVKLSSRITRLESPIRDILTRAKELEKEGKKLYPLNVGDPNKFDFDSPPHVKQAYIDAINNIPTKSSSYSSSEGDEELREEIAKTEKVSKDDVLITMGVSEGLMQVFASLLENSDNVLMPSPSYPPYIFLHGIFSTAYSFYETDLNWQPDLGIIRKKITEHTKAIILNNPNNPTGAVYSEKVLREIFNIAGEHKIPVISDEIYSGIEFDKKTKRACDIAKDVECVTMNGFSKVYLCTGYRIGYLAFRNLDPLKGSVIKLCRNRLSMNHPVQKAMLAALRGPKDYINETVKKLRERRDLIYKRLSQINGLEVVKPEGAFYTFPKITGGPWKTDKEFVYDLLEETGIISVFGKGCSPVLKDKHFRLIYLAQKEVLNEAMDKLEAFMTKRLS